MRRWLKFNLVGAIGIAVQLAALLALTRGLGLNYLLATALAVETAVVHNFIWHQYFTWGDRLLRGPAAFAGRLLHFNLTTGAVSIAGNLVLMRLLMGYAHLPAAVANLIAITTCWVVNYLVSDRLVFRAGPATK